MISVLLATYNGEKFLPQLLSSLEKQTCQNFRILARDDGSQDNTLLLLQQWQQRLSPRLEIFNNPLPGNGSCANFAGLLEANHSEFIMFCDQDDIWRPDKIAVTLNAMLSAQERHGQKCPLLVHTDMQVVNEAMQELCPSFWQYQKIDPAQGDQLNRILIHNPVTGCSAMMNLALAIRSLPIPPEAIMHDWWVGLVAAAFGKIIALPESTMAYRQHDQNHTGAHQWSLWQILKNMTTPQEWRRLRQSLVNTQAQAAAFHRVYSRDLSPELNQLVEAYAELAGQSFWKRRQLLWRYRIFKTGFLRNFSLFMRV